MVQAILFILARQLRLLERKVEIRVRDLDRAAAKPRTVRETRGVREVVKSESDDELTVTKKPRKEKKTKVKHLIRL